MSRVPASIWAGAGTVLVKSPAKQMPMATGSYSPACLDWVVNPSNRWRSYPEVVLVNIVSGSISSGASALSGVRMKRMKLR